ncbi:MAG: hypothetical protein RL701_4695 [Pseudomonadota bacterium]|jgi:urea transporter
MNHSFALFEPARALMLHELMRASTALLRTYAGIFFSSSLWVGALVLLATALVPTSCLLGLLAVGSAVVTARALGLVSESTPSSTYAYSALFLGLGASHTFAQLGAAVALATLGAAASVICTAAIGGWLQRLALPSLSLPFLLVYFCAISLGVALGATWAEPVRCTGLNTLPWPAPLRFFLEALGALLFTPRIDVGLIVFASLCVRGGQVPQLAALAFGITQLCAAVLARGSSSLWFAALINGIFSAILLGAGLFERSVWSYPRAALGVLFNVIATLALAGPLGRIGLSPTSLPFSLSSLAILLIARQWTAVTYTGADLAHAKE